VTGIHGRCEDRFGAVRDALAASLGRDDAGASAAVYLDGEPVVDLWGGYVDPAAAVAWQQDTITNVWSTTKTMTALCALILADRGELDLAAPVARSPRRAGDRAAAGAARGGRPGSGLPAQWARQSPGTARRREHPGLAAR
jgi:hypothetical protein